MFKQALQCLKWDMKKYLIFYFILILFTTFQSYSQSISKVKRILLGSWVCYQDTCYTLQIGQSVITERYTGTVDEELFPYQISRKNCGIKFVNCKEKCFFLKKTEGEDSYCYQVKNISFTHFTLIFEGGKVSDFIRKE